MNTTPNPRATKKSKGELVGPPLPPLDPVGEGEAEGEAEGAIMEGTADVEEVILPVSFLSIKSQNTGP